MNFNSSNKFKIFNFLSFQVGWFACAYGASHNMPILGIIAIILLISLHLYLSNNKKRDVKFIIIVGIIGGLVDTCQGLLGALSFYNEILPNWVTPYWLIALWMLFGTTLHYSLAWLNQKYWLSLLFGALGGPLSYYAGFKFGAFSLNENLVYSLVSIAIAWAIVTPFLFKLSHSKFINA